MSEEAERLGVQGQSQLHGESEISLGYITPFLKKPTQKEKIEQTNNPSWTSKDVKIFKVFLKYFLPPLILGLGRQRQTDL